jgi:DNA-directed RNA polymerase specialized sigma24 family protein
VFVDCLRQGGVLQRADPVRGDFRGFLFGVVRIVAMRLERSRGLGQARLTGAEEALQAMPAEDTAASRQFDREWARSTMRLAMRVFAREADAADETRAQRLELLRLRFDEGLPIRDIAVRWSRDPAWVHHEFARARRDFKKALGQALGLAEGAPPAHLAAEIARLWEALG